MNTPAGWAEGETRDCGNCGGNGTRTVTSPAGNYEDVTCTACHGRGWINVYPED